MFAVNRKELRAALGAVKPAVARRPGIPALEAVVIDAAHGRATLTATDLELAVVAELEATGEPARLLVPFKILAETVKAGAGDVVRFGAGEGSVTVDGASIRLGELADFPTLSAETPATYAGTIEAGAFVRGAAAACAAASKDEARPVLTGVMLELGPGIGDPTGARMVATDSYRLHVAHVDGSGELSAIVPARAIAHVARSLGRKPAGVVSIAGGESEVRFVLPDGLEVRSRIIEGEYPNYRQLVPARGVGTVVRFELAEALAALKSAAPYCRDTSPVRLEVLEALGDQPARVQLSASAPDLGAWSGNLERVTVHGPGVSVAFNPAYLGGALEAAGDGGALEVRDGLKPAAAWSASGLTVGLVMPVRLPAAAEAREAEERSAAISAEAETRPAERAAAELHRIGARPRIVRAEVEPEPERTAEDEVGAEIAAAAAAERAELEPEPEVEVDASEGAELEPEPEVPMHRPFGVGAPAPVIEERPTAELELERMRAELEAATAALEAVKAAEVTPARPDVGGFTEWAELAEVGIVGRVHVRVVGGADGRPAVDVRVYGGSRGYTGRTKAGFRIGLEDAAELARIIGDGAEQGAELER